MSFNNDEDGDGLAALFGGITPQATPKPAEAAQPAAAPTPAAQPPAGAGYPAGAPGVAPASAPGYPSATSYDLPAPSDASPASAYSAASPSPASPQYPGLAPAPTAAPQVPPTQYPPTQYAPTQYPPTQYSAPQSPATQNPAPQFAAPQAPAAQPPTNQPPTTPYAPPQYPGLETPAGYPGLAPQGAPAAPTAYDLPAPAGQQPASQQPFGQQGAQYAVQPPPAGVPSPLTEPSGYPGYEQPVPGYASTPDFAQPATYDLPPPTAAPTPAYDPLPPTAQPTPLVPPGQEQYGSPAATASYGASDYAASDSRSSESAAGGELLPTLVVPAGPLLPSTTAAVETPEDLERSTVGEKVGLALAVVAGPIGLLVAIVNAVRGGRRRGWLIGISRISLVLGVLSTIATIIAGIILWNIRVDQMQHDELAAASAEFCAAAEADPAMVTPPTVGFPTQGHSIPDTIDAMTAWTNRWTELAATSPAELRTGLELLATKGQEIIDSVTESRSVDDALNAQVIGSVEAQSGVSAWYTNYCVAP